MDIGVNVHQILLGETVKVTHWFLKKSFLYVRMCDWLSQLVPHLHQLTCFIKPGFKKLENVNWKLEYIHTYKIQTNFNILYNLHMIWNSHKSVSSFYEENNFKLCWTRQLLNVFKLWCEWGTSSLAFGLMGYWLRGHDGERNNCFSKIQLVG